MKTVSFITRSVLTLCLLAGSISAAFSQAHDVSDFYSDLNKPDYHPPSPEAASLGKYGQFNVSMNTGIPDITIPIYDLKVGSFTFPISISYNASGIKVAEVASRVGLGWSLNAGGVIGQNAMGILDGAQTMLIPPSTFSPACGAINCTPNDDYNLAKQIIDNRQYDTEPDLYTYNFLGFSGKYIVTNTGIATLPFDPEISFDNGITDKNGNHYFFGATETSTVMRNCNTYTKNPLHSGPTAYYLTKVITALGDTIQLNYDTEIYSYFQSTLAKKYFRTDQSCTLPTDLLCTDKNSVVVPRLKNIIASNGITVQFGYNEVRADVETSSNPNDPFAAKVLNQITVTESGAMGPSLPFTYTFEYDPINSGPGSNGVAATGKRIYLKKCTLNNGGFYQFSYTMQSSLPPRDSYSVDHWGYYNGRTNSTLIPSYSALSFVGGDRGVTPFSVLAGSLERITYPTGGYTVFELEPHSADVSGYIGGGLRVKTISNYESNNALLSQKKYTYVSTIANGTPDEAMIIGNYLDAVTHRRANDGGGAFDVLCQFTIMSSGSSPFFDNTGFNASVHYPQVTVTDSDETQSGKSIYYYQGIDFGNTPAPGPLTDGRMEFKLKKEEHYRYVSPTVSKLLSTKTYEYQTILPALSFMGFDNSSTALFDSPTTPNTSNYGQVIGFRIKYDISEQSDGAQIPAFYPAQFSYYHYMYTAIWFNLKSVTEEVYDGKDATIIQSTKTDLEYENPAHAQLTKTTTHNSKGDELIHITRYPQDYTASPFQGSSVPLNLFKGVPVEELSFVNDSIVSAQANQLQFQNGALTLLEKYVSTPNEPIPASAAYPTSNTHNFNFLVGNVYREYYRVTGTDLKGNPTELTSTASNGDFKQALLWNSRKRQLLAIADNAPAGSIAYTDFDNADKGGWDYGNSYIPPGGPGFAMSASFSGSSVALKQNFAAGVYRLSMWAKGATLETLVISTDVSSTIDVLPSYAGNDNWHLYEWKVTLNAAGKVTITNGASAYLDNIRLCPFDSKMTTYSYSPLLGLTSKTDSNNRSENYSYDAAGRLLSIRDDAGNILKTFEYHVVNGPSN